MSEALVRAFWVGLSPLAWVGHQLGICSYKWVNICHGARRRDRFNPLWHHRYYGTPIRHLPGEVILCGIGYRAASSEGIVTFVEEFTRNRITFERDSLDGDQLWRVTLSGSTSAPHVKEAYEWVCAVFGGSFTVRAARAGEVGDNG